MNIPAASPPFSGYFQCYDNFIVTFKFVTGFREHIMSTVISILLSMIFKWTVSTWCLTNFPVNECTSWSTHCPFLLQVRIQRTETVHHCLHRKPELSNKTGESNSDISRSNMVSEAWHARPTHMEMCKYSPWALTSSQLYQRNDIANMKQILQKKNGDRFVEILDSAPFYFPYGPCSCYNRDFILWSETGKYFSHHRP